MDVQFTLAAALGDNLTGATIDPESFILTAGGLTLSSTTPLYSAFTVSTNDTGQIESWYIVADNQDGSNTLAAWIMTYSSISCEGGECGVGDEAATNEATYPQSYEAAISGDPGTWTTETSTVPEPSETPFLMILVAVGALASMLRSPSGGTCLHRRVRAAGP